MEKEFVKLDEILKDVKTEKPAEPKVLAEKNLLKKDNYADCAGCCCLEYCPSFSGCDCDADCEHDYRG
ncbi:MAG: hypothetical protein KAT77_03750 [Nanoarchaeota archaeon]|nr:hypothetical protein [Nanoarchaeota archaeon]